jgi:AcrR family transcriptional regulator
MIKFKCVVKKFKDKYMVKTRGLQERRQEIVNTARRLFQAEGYDKITMQRIVDGVGIAKGTVFYYFESKEDLLKAVVEDIIQEDAVRKHLLIEKTSGNALDKMRAVMQLESMALKYPRILESLHEVSNTAMHSQLLAVMVINEAHLYAKLIRQGCHEGIFQTDNPLECAEFFIAGIQFLTDTGIYPWSEADMERRARAFPYLLEGLLKAQPGSFQFMVSRLSA